LLRFTNVYNPHQALGARTAAPRIENCRTGATMDVGTHALGPDKAHPAQGHWKQAGEA